MQIWFVVLVTHKSGVLPVNDRHKARLRPPFLRSSFPSVLLSFCTPFLLSSLTPFHLSFFPPFIFSPFLLRSSPCTLLSSSFSFLQTLLSSYLPLSSFPLPLSVLLHFFLPQLFSLLFLILSFLLSPPFLITCSFLFFHFLILESPAWLLKTHTVDMHTTHIT